MPVYSLALLVFGAALVSASHAQVVLDGKFGTTGALVGPNYNISADLGSVRGNNLFHSFTQFDLKGGDLAEFSGPATIRNVLSRVTGGRASSIDGTLRSSITGANFYFINPSGVIFGPNASVDVSGAFSASTANYLRLADDAKFVASLDADDSLLSSAPVAAFGFLDGAKGAVEVHGSLRSGTGSPLSLVGSSVLVSEGAALEAPGSQITFMGVGAPGEVAPALRGDIKGGVSLPPHPNSTPGTILIRGGRLVVENARVDASRTGAGIDIAVTDSVEIRNGGQVTTQSAGPVKGGDISLVAPTVIVDHNSFSVPTRVAAETSSEHPGGDGGSITVRSESVGVYRGGEITTSSYAAGDSGRIEITTSSLKLEGNDFGFPPTQISANAAGLSGTLAGSGGEIVIHATSIELSKLAVITAYTWGGAAAGTIDIKANSIAINGGSISAYTGSLGNGGDIRIVTGGFTLDGMFSSVVAYSTALENQLPAGRGGNIDITADFLQMKDNSAISSSTYGDGSAGNISINAKSILLDTGEAFFGIFPGISSSAGRSFDGTPNVGGGGNITVNAGSLTLRNGMHISATTATPGASGNINVQTGSLQLDKASSIQAASLGEGSAGIISINASGPISLTGNSSVSTSAPQSSGGNIQIISGSQIQLTESQFTARAGPGGGGNIEVQATDLVYLMDSAFDAQAVGNGGNLTVTEPVFFVVNQSELISKSVTQDGGNITILSGYFLASDGIIDASAPFGLPGTVTVTAPNVDLSGSLIGLPSRMLDAESQLRAACAVRLPGNLSSFIVLGRGGLPLQPGGLLPSGMAPMRE